MDIIEKLIRFCASPITAFLAALVFAALSSAGAIGMYLGLSLLFLAELIALASIFKDGKDTGVDLGKTLRHSAYVSLMFLIFGIIIWKSQPPQSQLPADLQLKVNCALSALPNPVPDDVSIVPILFADENRGNGLEQHTVTAEAMKQAPRVGSVIPAYKCLLTNVGQAFLTHVRIPLRLVFKELVHDAGAPANSSSGRFIREQEWQIEITEVNPGNSILFFKNANENSTTIYFPSSVTAFELGATKSRSVHLTNLTPLPLQFPIASVN
jgi:hypothetical protein